MERSGDSGGDEEADVSEKSALGSGWSRYTEVCGTALEDGRLVALAREEGQDKEDQGEEQDDPLSPAPAFAADDEAPDNGTERTRFSSMEEEDGIGGLPCHRA